MTFGTRVSTPRWEPNLHLLIRRRPKDLIVPGSNLQITVNCNSNVRWNHELNPNRLTIKPTPVFNVTFTPVKKSYFKDLIYYQILDMVLIHVSPTVSSSTSVVTNVGSKYISVSKKQQRKAKIFYTDTVSAWIPLQMLGSMGHFGPKHNIRVQEVSNTQLLSVRLTWIVHRQQKPFCWQWYANIL